MARVVLVEDERELARLVHGALEEDGHVVEVFHDGRSALERLLPATDRGPDLIILDVMLPGVDGLEILRRVRQRHVTPILMLTARSTELDKVLGLELGADDYVTKPFSLRELQARVTAVLRRVEMLRASSRTEEVAAPVVDDRLRIDPTARSVLADGRAVAVTPREFDLLHLLAANPGRVFSRDYLLDRLWGDDYEGGDRTVDTHVLRLRRKLGGSGSVADRLVTLWGVGYKYERSGP
ncbi:MAG TPA: response regulator transcription factor [Thermomicrobiaceae bacterium]|nr:response regulator transcription factor [Thermomicrobiaceae bacterium]